MSTIILAMAGSSHITSFWLKVVAIVAMTCNHAGYIFYAHLPLAARCILIGVGGLTFPIMAFLLVEGFFHTSNVRRYATRLGVFAFLAQVPFWLFLAHQGNVLVTLFASLLMLVACSKIEQEGLRPFVAIAVAAATIWCDWGVLGPLMVYVMYATRTTLGQTKGSTLATLIPAASALVEYGPAVAGGSTTVLPFLLYGAGNAAAIPLLAAYNGQRGAHPLKWFFYVYYPAHITVLGLLYFALFGTWHLVG